MSEELMAHCSSYFTQVWLHTMGEHVLLSNGNCAWCAEQKYSRILFGTWCCMINIKKVEKDVRMSEATRLSH